jgi:hypothetical protein
MNRFRSGTIWGITLLMLFGILAVSISTDDDGKRHQRREGRDNKNNYRGVRNLKPVSNSTYTDQCSACHFAYQPELLPADSWRKILADTDDHF